MNWIKRFIGKLMPKKYAYSYAFNNAGPSKKDPYELRGMGTEELCIWIALKPLNSGLCLLGMNELKKRQELESKRIAYIALFISIASFVISAIRPMLP